MDSGEMVLWVYFEVGSGTRRRPIGRDYGAAKMRKLEVEVGKPNSALRVWEGQLIIVRCNHPFVAFEP